MIYTKYADCLPVYIYDIKNRVISLVHSGWKGNMKDRALESIKLMEQNFKSRKRRYNSSFWNWNISKKL